MNSGEVAHWLNVFYPRGPSSRINDGETPAGNKECKTEFLEDIVRRQMDRWTQRVVVVL
jgi:hypothetical protein